MVHVLETKCEPPVEQRQSHPVLKWRGREARGGDPVALTLSNELIALQIDPQPKGRTNPQGRVDRMR